MDDKAIISEVIIEESRATDANVDEQIDPDEEALALKVANSKKCKCLLQIIRGEKIREQVTVDGIGIPGLLEGTSDLGFAKDKKVIIFSDYTETTVDIEYLFKINNITYAKLHGSDKKINEIVKSYSLPYKHSEANNILIITGSKYCAGLNLQMTTDVIFMNKLANKKIELQIAARAARHGRQSNLIIHYILYNNECRH